MAKKIAHNGLVKVAGNTVASIARIAVNQSCEVIDNTDLTDTEKAYEAGDTEWSAEIECKWDKADTTGQGAMTIGAKVALTYQPEGDTSGDYTESGNGIITASGKVNEKGSMVTQSFSVMGDGALTAGTVA